MRVYCKNCKYCKYREFASLGVNWGWFCKLRDIREVNQVGNTIVDFGASNCKDLNLDYSCKLYKRKWWKFWIRGEA